jgi:hypothetical protein
VIKAIDKIQRGFLWKGRKDVKGGHCLVGWKKVCRLIDMGGLGIHNLEFLSWSLNMRWLWLQKPQPDRPWKELELQVHPNAASMFSISVIACVGDGVGTFFWTDRWLHGQSHLELAPSLMVKVPKKWQKIRTVQEALLENKWVADITGSISAQALMEYFSVWNLIQGFQITPGVQDQHIWRPSSSGMYSSKSACERFFVGALEFEPAKRIWKSWAPPRCKYFLWLAALDRCWTADRLAHRGLEHPDKCVLCDQQDETIQHILLARVFLETFGSKCCLGLGYNGLLLGVRQHFQDWWLESELKVPKQFQKGFNSLVILVAWGLWKHRNAGVFDKSAHNVHKLL